MSEIPGQFLIASGVCLLWLLAASVGCIGAALLGWGAVREAREWE